MEPEAKTPRPEPPCSLPKAGNACVRRSLDSCEKCGWNPKEMERRKALPLKRGEDGRYHKDISREEHSSQPGGL